MNTDELRKTAKCIFIVVNEEIAQDIAEKLNKAADEIDKYGIEYAKSYEKDKDETILHPPF